MTAAANHPQPRRSRAMATAVARFWRLDRPMTGTWAALSVLGPLMPLGIAVAAGRVVNAAIDVAHQGFDSPAGHRLNAALVTMTVVTLVGILFDTVRWRLADWLGSAFRADQRQRIMATFLGRAGVEHLDDPAWQDGARAADNEWLRTLPEGLMNVVGTRINGYGAAALIAAHDPLSAAVLTAAWAYGGRWKWRRAAEDVKAGKDQVGVLRRATATAELATSARAAKEIRLFGLGDWLGARFAREWHTAMDDVWRNRRGGLKEGTVVIGALLAAHALALGRLGAAAGAGRLSLGALTVVLPAVLATRGIGGVPYGMQEIHYGLSAIPALTRLEAMVAAVPDLSGDVAAPVLAQAIRVQGVRYRYPRSEREVLAGIDFEVPAGTSVAIVGDNGAGKSTLVQLLARLRDPSEGRITVDGVDLATIDPLAWQQSVAAVSQNALRLPLSARRNVAGGRHDFSSDGVLDRAAADANAADIIAALASGWDTPMSREFTGGADVSGGEWQRLALARALVGIEAGAALLVLDEPTAHLDVRAEADLYDHFLELTRGRTTVLVSHRFSTVRRADRIVVLDEGRVVEQGSHDELLVAGGRYAEMFALQASRFTETDTGAGARGELAS